MQLTIHAHGISLTEEIKRQAHQKLDLALDRLGEDVDRISVYLIDTNGPLLGGIDKACRIVVLLHSQDSLVVEDVDKSVDVVIDRITDRLGVAACQRADSLRKNRNPQRRLFDPEDFPSFEEQNRESA